MDGNDGDDNDGQVVSGSLEDCCEIIARFEMERNFVFFI